MRGTKPASANQGLCTATARGDMRKTILPIAITPLLCHGRHSGGLVRRGGIMSIRRILSDTSGATAIEYGLIVALIALAIMGAMQSLGGGVGGMWTFNDQEFNTAIDSALDQN